MATDTKILIPNCWTVMGCAEEQRRSCTAYPYNGKTCWMVSDANCGLAGRDELDAAEKVNFCRSECGFFKDYIKA